VAKKQDKPKEPPTAPPAYPTVPGLTLDPAYRLVNETEFGGNNVTTRAVNVLTRLGCVRLRDVQAVATVGKLKAEGCGWLVVAAIGRTLDAAGLKLPWGER